MVLCTVDYDEVNIIPLPNLIEQGLHLASRSLVFPTRSSSFRIKSVEHLPLLLRNLLSAKGTPKSFTERAFIIN